MSKTQAPDPEDHQSIECPPAPEWVESQLAADAKPSYSIQTLTDMLKVPPERRSVMLRELETALLTHELAFGDEAQSVAANMTWTDDGDRTVDITANGKPLLTLKVQKKAGAIPAPEGALRAAASQALDALEQLQGGCTDSDDGTVECITVWCPEIIDALRAALAAPAPQAPVALTDEQIRDVWSEKVRWHGPPMGLTDLEFAHDAIAEFCRVNGIKEPTNDR